MSSGREITVGLHCHSVWSYDGSWTLPDLSAFFRRRGYDAMMMSEHDTGFDPGSWPRFVEECAAASEAGGCRLFPGIEYSSPDNAIHILTWGLDRFLAEHRPVEETLNRVAEGGGVAVYAHPARREAWRLFEPSWTPLLSGVEIWNRKTDGVAPGAVAERLAKESGLSPTFGIDFHVRRHYWPLSHRIAVGEDWQADIVRAIRAGGLDTRVFGRRARVGADGRLSAPVSRAAEVARRGLRAVRKRVRGR